MNYKHKAMIAQNLCATVQVQRFKDDTDELQTLIDRLKKILRNDDKASGIDTSYEEQPR